LGLGIGANAAMLGIVDQMLLRNPAYLRDPALVNRVYLSWTSNGTDRTERNFQFARYLDLASLTHSFSSMAAFTTNGMAVGEGDDTRERPVMAASANYFEFFNARPALGRFYT